MKILTITDLHGRPVVSLTGFGNIDLVLFLGDITTGGSLNETKIRIRSLQDAYPLLYAIPGNWDRRESRQWLRDEGLSIDQRSVIEGKVQLYGVGGSTPTPFNTPNEFSEESFSSKLKGYPDTDKSRKSILCSHNPPYGACDKTLLGKHVGSKYLRRFIEDKQPDLVLCGHIHEGRGQDMINNTQVVNPGTAPKHYALIEIGEDIEAELI